MTIINSQSRFTPLAALLLCTQLLACEAQTSDAAGGAAGSGEVAAAELALVSCSSSWQCYFRAPETPRCDRATRTCVQCLSDRHCSGGDSCLPGGSCGAAGDTCGNGVLDSAETCDPTVSGFTPATCDSDCRPRTLYTPCDDNDDCIAPTECDPSGFGAGYCSPPCTEGDTSQCHQDTVPAGSVTACFGGLCLIECDVTAECPEPMSCAGPLSYCLP